MSGHRRRSSSYASEAVYHAIPQAPVAANAIPRRPSLDLELEDEELNIAEVIVDNSTAAENDPRIRWIHFVLGCAVLLPWNALITATPYFLSRMEGSPLKSTFSSYLSTTFTAANFLFLAHATATSKQSSMTRRVLLSISWLAVLSFMLTMSTYMHPHPGIFFAFVLLNAIAQAAAGSYLQTAVVAIASLFGPSAMQAVMSGQAAVGVAVSGVQVLSAAASMRGSPAPEVVVAETNPEENSAFIFFGLSTLFLIASAAIHSWLVSLPSYKAIVEQTSLDRRTTAQENAGLLDEPGSLSTDEHGYRKLREKNHIVRIAKVNWIYNVAVAYVFTITLAVFPPITISVQPTNPSVSPLLFSATHFLVFNIGDFLGRYVCSFPRVLIWSANRLFALSFARTLFIPLFLMCNVQRASSLPTSSASGPIINSDILFMIILLSFGLSNGYVSSLCMMSAPSVAHNPRLKGRVEDVDVAATVASFCLVGGLAMGSLLSFAVRAAVCDCNPFRE